jgi:hypothetical protein
MSGRISALCRSRQDAPSQSELNRGILLKLGVAAGAIEHLEPQTQTPEMNQHGCEASRRRDRLVREWQRTVQPLCSLMRASC